MKFEYNIYVRVTNKTRVHWCYNQLSCPGVIYTKDDWSVVSCANPRQNTSGLGMQSNAKRQFSQFYSLLCNFTSVMCTLGDFFVEENKYCDI